MTIPKILGTETEYSITGRHDPERGPTTRTFLRINCHQPEARFPSLRGDEHVSSISAPRAMPLDDAYNAPDLSSPVTINEALANGLRLSLDHVRAACTMPAHVNTRAPLRYEEAGDCVLDQSHRATEPTLTAGQQILLYRSNSDYKGNSCSCHGNPLPVRYTLFRPIVEQFTPLFASLQIFCGAGSVGVEPSSELDVYHLSQQADVLEVVKSPLINTHGEPHANRER